jgi:acetoin utilization deacetylase AcuC-like enzyme
VTPITSNFDPKSIVISLGADAHHLDPPASLALSNPCHMGCISMIQDIGKAVPAAWKEAIIPMHFQTLSAHW